MCMRARLINQFDSIQTPNFYINWIPYEDMWLHYVSLAVLCFVFFSSKKSILNNWLKIMIIRHNFVGNNYLVAEWADASLDVHGMPHQIDEKCHFQLSAATIVAASWKSMRTNSSNVTHSLNSMNAAPWSSLETSSHPFLGFSCVSWF